MKIIIIICILIFALCNITLSQNNKIQNGQVAKHGTVSKTFEGVKEYLNTQHCLPQETQFKVIVQQIYQYYGKSFKYYDNLKAGKFQFSRDKKLIPFPLKF